MPKPKRAQHRYGEHPVSAYETYIGTDRLQTITSSEISRHFLYFQLQLYECNQNTDLEKISAEAGILSVVFARTERKNRFWHFRSNCGEENFTGLERHGSLCYVVSPY